ncbi:phosphatase PAP2 family protein [Amycolatopsis sp. NPDC004378]
MTRVGPAAAAPALPRPVRAPLFAVAVVAAVVAVVLGFLFHGHTVGTDLDEAVYRALRGSIDPPFVYGVAWVVGSLGDPAGAALIVVVLGVVFLRSGQTRLTILIVAGPVVTGVVTTLAKPVASRFINGDNLSYPSGHTAFLTSAGLVIGLFLTTRYGLGRVRGTALVLALGLLLAATMSWSQTSNRVHYLSDTFGGFCVAIALVTATAALVDAVIDRVKARR